MRSGDQRLRALERAAAAGDPRARLAWFRERLRLGHLERLPILELVAQAIGAEEAIVPNDLRNGLRAALDQEGISRRGSKGLVVRANREDATVSPRDWSDGARPAMRRASALLGIRINGNLRVLARPLTAQEEAWAQSASLPPEVMGAFLDGYLRDRLALVEGEAPATYAVGQIVRLRRPRARRRWVVSAVSPEALLDLTALTGLSKYTELVRPEQVVLDADQTLRFAHERLRQRHETRRDDTP